MAPPVTQRRPQDALVRAQPCFSSLRYISLRVTPCFSSLSDVAAEGAHYKVHKNDCLFFFFLFAQRKKAHTTSHGTMQQKTSRLAADGFIAALSAIPAEDWCRTWPVGRTIMLRMTSKRVKEVVDKSACLLLSACTGTSGTTHTMSLCERTQLL